MNDSNKEPLHPVMDTDFKDVDLSSRDEANECNGDVSATDITSEKKQVAENANLEDETFNITWRLYKNYKISICKPLIPLKLALILWFGAGSIIGSFLAVYFKQRGLALSELSTIFMISPFAQFLGSTASGIIADKLGRSKPVLVGNLVITLLAVTGMLLMPRMNSESCNPQPLNIKCHYQEFYRLMVRSTCDIEDKVFEVTSCNIQCPENVTEYCFGQNIICEILESSEGIANFSLLIHVNETFKTKNKCFYNVRALTHKNRTYSWCNVPHKMYCRINCSYFSEEKCNRERGSRWRLLVANMVLLMLFFTTFTTCYRIFDVTAMSLVKEYNSDFGRECFFSVLGVLIFTPVAGYVVDANTSPGDEKHYASAFYCFIGMCILTLAIIYKLKVKINPPGRNMWKKALNLLKNADLISFICILFMLGTTWNFMKNFTNWFLVELDTPGILFGLIPAVNGIYGLPFLLTSKWWVQKIGSPNIFLLALLGYVCSAIGYSFLFNPWYSLLLEVTSIFTFHLLWVTVILHSHEIAPEGLTATVISTAGGIHFNIGKGSGSLIGGLIMDSFGGRIAYRVIAVICLISAVMYGIYIYIRRIYFTQNHDVKNRDTDENPENAKESKEIHSLQNKI